MQNTPSTPAQPFTPAHSFNLVQGYPCGYNPFPAPCSSVGAVEDQPLQPARTQWSQALVALVSDVLGSTESGPGLDTVLATIQWMRDHPAQSRMLIGDLTRGY